MVNKKRLFYGLLIIMWCFIIFYFSNTNANDSSNMSMGIVKMFINLIYPKFDLLNVQRRNEILSIIHLLIRKLAHMTEFGILYFLIFQFITTYKKLYILPLFFTIVYAAFDEIHQLFIEGRSGNIADIMIDSIGAIIMLCIVYLYQKLFRTH